MIVSGAKWIAVEILVSRVFQLLSAFFVARVLGPEVMGLVALVLVTLEIFRVLSEMGITQALIHQKDPTSEQIATLYTLNWLLAATVYLAIYLLAPYVAAFFEQGGLAEIIKIAGMSVIITALGQQTIALLQKELRFKAISIISMVAAALNVVVAISLVSLGWGIWAIVIAQLVAVTVRSGCAFIYGCRCKLFNGFGFSFKSVRPILSFGLYQTGAMSMNMINSRADQIIIGKSMGATALGIYSIGTQITLQAMQQINSVATRVAFPAVSKSQDDIEEVKRIYLSIIENVLLVSAPLFIGLAVVSPVFVDVVLGESWSELSPVLSILCGYVLVRSLGNVNGPLVMGLGKAKWAFYWNLMLLLIIPFVIFLSSLAGDIKLVALSLFFTQVFLLFAAYFYWVRRLVGPCGKQYVLAIARPVLSAGLMGAVVALIYSFVPLGSQFLILLTLIFSGGAFYMFFSMMINKKNTTNFVRNIIGA